MLLYFRGCTAREKLNSISEDTESLLKLFNIDYETLDDEQCCGSVLLRTGFKDDAIEQMNRNYSALKGKIILTSCAGCYKTLKEDYKSLLDADLEVIHISQLLDQLIKKNDIKLDKKDLTVTYHDPCHLGRHAGEYEAPRSVISAFSNLNEMKNIKEKSRCCGSGGGVKSAYGDLSNSIAKLRLEEAEETGADLLVSACPFCKLNLSQNSENLEVLDLSEFVLKMIDDNNLDFSDLKSLNGDNFNLKSFKKDNSDLKSLNEDNFNLKSFNKYNSNLNDDGEGE